MADEKIGEFFEGVLAKTREGRILWKPTADESDFIAAIGGQFTLSTSVWTEQGSWGKETRKYTLALRDQSGRELTKVAEDDLARPDELRELYEAARRKALRVDEKIGDVLEVLKKL
jgi:hypothetical protein